MILYPLKQIFKQLYGEMCRLGVHPYSPNINVHFRWVRLRNYPSTTFFFCFIQKDIATFCCEMDATEFEPCKTIRVKISELPKYVLDFANLRFNKKGLNHFAKCIKRIKTYYSYKPVLIYDLNDPLERPIVQPLFYCKCCKQKVLQLYSTMDYPEEKYDELCETCFDQLKTDYNIVSYFEIDVCVP